MNGWRPSGKSFRAGPGWRPPQRAGWDWRPISSLNLGAFRQQNPWNELRGIGAQLGPVNPALLNHSRGHNWELPRYHWLQGLTTPQVPSGTVPGAPPMQQQMWQQPQTWMPGLGLQGPSPQQIREQQQTSRYQNMGQAGVTQTANGLWSVREQRYLTPEEAAAFGG